MTQAEHAFRQFAEHMADTARSIALNYFRQPLTIQQKQDASPVTLADQEIEQTLRALLAELFPMHGVLGEEFANQGLEQTYVWIIDPIDGTKSFASGRPLFGTLIALSKNNEIELGIIEAPALQERWCGIRGKATYFNNLICKTSACRDLRKARLAVTSPHMFQRRDWSRFERINKSTAFCCYGGDCYSYGLLASGYVDLVIEAQLKPFDFAALIPIIEGAGGVISDWQGQALNLQSEGYVIAAATPELHQQALAMLQ